MPALRFSPSDVTWPMRRSVAGGTAPPRVGGTGGGTGGGELEDRAFSVCDEAEAGR